ncbi:hypothetical protein DV736_g4544, partial [Chaetothyriales sp. CBS 134916]
MNSQQFNMGMARGIASMNQVNPAFGLNNSMVNQMARQQPMPMSQGMAQAGQLQRHILMSLQNQGPFTAGWQAAVAPPERMNQVKMIVDSLKLVRPPVDQARAVEVAIHQHGQQSLQTPNPTMQDQAQQNKQKAPELTNADNQAINRRAAELAEKTSPEKIREIMSTMSPEFCNNIRSKGMEPIVYYFRMHATREFRSKKRPDAAQQPAQPVQPAQPNGAIMQGQQNVAIQNQPFSNLGRYQGQQADGLRSQEGGEVVVPASNHQPIMPGMMQRNGQITNPNYTVQQHQLQFLQQQQNMQRLALRNQQQATAQAQAPMAQPAQPPVQPSTPMQMLNQPLNQAQPGLSPQPGPRPASRTPMPQQISVQELQPREQILSRLPPAVQNMLRTKPPSEWPAILNQFRQNSMMQRSASQTSQAFGRQQSIQNGPFPASSTIGTPMQQSLSAGQQVRPLDAQESKFMDAQAVPVNTLNAMRRQQVPVPTVKNWYELKEWAISNPIGNPTTQDIQSIKVQNPQLQIMSDDQVRQMLIARRRDQITKAMQQQAAQRGAMIKPIQAPNEPLKKELSAPKPPQQELTRLPNLPKDMPPEQRTQYIEAFHRQQNERKARNEERARKLIEFDRQLQPKITQHRPLKLDQNTRSQMAARLTTSHVKSMMSHFDQFLNNYPDIDPNEADWKKFVEYKLDLFAQYQQASVADKTWIAQDVFSVTPERLEMMLNELNAKFGQLNSTVATSKPQQQPSNANWARHTGQEPLLKQSKAGDSAPPAPTTDRPPFPFSDPRGHLAATSKYASPTLKQEDAKRRKKNQATLANNAAPPASATQPTAPSPQALKQQQPPPPAVMFRCPISSCQQASWGFISQTELDQHINTAHMTDINPSTDQLAFLDTTLRDVFNLDENYYPLPTLKATPMERTTSKSSLADGLKIESKPATPSLPTKAPSCETVKDENANVLEEWKAVKINSDQWSQIFEGWDWEEVVPSSVLKLQNDFIATYQQSEEWQSLLRPASTADTTTDKSTSPPAAAAAKHEPKADADQDDSFVDLSAIDGLDLSDLDEVVEAPPTHLHAASDANGDVFMANSQSNSDDMSSSPFEMVDKPDPEALGVAQFLLDHGIDYTRPDELTSEQRRLMDFVMEPFEATGVRDASDAINETDWEVDWEQVYKQYEQDVQNRVPGTWTPDGFISEPSKRWW